MVPEFTTRWPFSPTETVILRVTDTNTKWQTSFVFTQSLLHFSTFQADNVITPTTSAPSTEVGCCHLKYAPSENCHSQVVRSPTHNSAVRFNINTETKDTALKLETLQQFIWQAGVVFLSFFLPWKTSVTPFLGSNWFSEARTQVAVQCCGAL